MDVTPQRAHLHGYRPNSGKMYRCSSPKRAMRLMRSDPHRGQKTTRRRSTFSPTSVPLVAAATSSGKVRSSSRVSSQSENVLDKAFGRQRNNRKFQRLGDGGILREIHNSRIAYSGVQRRSRANPCRARSATARANVGESFSDAGRSSRIPMFAAYSRNRWSTSNRIST